jgi:hypothetical protein
MTETIFTALNGVPRNGRKVIPLADGLTLIRPNAELTSGSWSASMSGMDEATIKQADRFLVYRHDPTASGEIPSVVERLGSQALQSGVMAFQVIKPIRTLGYIHRGSSGDKYGFKRTQYVPEFHMYKAPMNPGRWATMNKFDRAMLGRIPDMIARIRAAYQSHNVPMINALSFLQLGLEHGERYIAGLLWMTGLEAIFDSGGKETFKRKLCALLGARTKAFPNWHSKADAPAYTVEDIAIPLFVLRNKLAHGQDLTTAATDTKYPVDLLARMNLTSQTPSTTHASVLSEAACYLLCQVLDKSL